MEQQYEEYENSKNVISYYSKWNFVENDLYSRDIDTYKVGDITEEKIIKLINEDVESLKEVLGEPISRKKEIKNNLSKEEIESNSFLQAKLYSRYDDDFIMVKEFSSDNIGLTMLWLILTVFAEFIPGIWRSDCSSFDYDYCIREIKRTHLPKDIGVLRKRLEIKRDNYDRLVR